MASWRFVGHHSFRPPPNGRRAETVNRPFARKVSDEDWDLGDEGLLHSTWHVSHSFWPSMCSESIPEILHFKEPMNLVSKENKTLLSWPKLACSWLGPLWPNHAPGILSHTAPLQLQAGSLRCRWNFPSPWETELQRGRASQPGTSSFCPARCDSVGSCVLLNKPTHQHRQTTAPHHLQRPQKPNEKVGDMKLFEEEVASLFLGVATS